MFSWMFFYVEVVSQNFSYGIFYGPIFSQPKTEWKI